VKAAAQMECENLNRFNNKIPVSCFHPFEVMMYKSRKSPKNEKSRKINKDDSIWRMMMTIWIGFSVYRDILSGTFPSSPSNQNKE
jgi:hypothetical protein